MTRKPPSPEATAKAPRRGRVPPEEYRFKEGQSGNLAGRPPKQRLELPRPDFSDIAATLRRIAASTVPMKLDGNRVELPYTEALCHQITMSALDDPRIGLRVLDLLNRIGTQNDNLLKETPDDIEGELDAILEREVKRRCRRLLQSENKTADAERLMNDMYQLKGSPSSGDAQRDAEEGDKLDDDEADDDGRGRAKR